jgi:hypothetical protein
MPSIRDLRPYQKHGRLTLLELVEIVKDPLTGRVKKYLWNIRCECGQEKILDAAAIAQKKTTSCGCYAKEIAIKRLESCRGRNATHGASRKGKMTREYSIWRNMKTRCYNPRYNRYSDYGGRGITMDDRWLGAEGFKNFLNDMGECPTPEHSIDRIDNDGSYHPGNCRWATRFEQARNKRNNTIIEFQGERLTLSQWAERLGHDSKDYLLCSRLMKGWGVEDAITTPRRKFENVIEWNGRCMNVSQWAKEYGIASNVVRERLRRGWEMKRALTDPVKKINYSRKKKRDDTQDTL